jgi:hypothetical protein
MQVQAHDWKNFLVKGIKFGMSKSSWYIGHSLAMLLLAPGGIGHLKQRKLFEFWLPSALGSYHMDVEDLLSIVELQISLKV